MLEQQLDDVHIAARSGQRERGVVAHVAVLLVGLPVEEDVHHLVLAARAGEREGGVLGPLGLGLDVGGVVQEDVHHLVVPGSGGQDQGGEALLITVFYGKEGVK